MSTHAIIAAAILAAYAAGMTALAAFTRNGRHAIRVLLLAVHYRFVPAYGKHGHEDEPDKVRDVLRELAAAAVHGCLFWPAGEMPRHETPRAPVAASAPGDGPAPVPPAPGAGPLTPATAPQPALTAPQPALTEPPNPAPNWAPPAGWTPYEPAVPDVIA